MKRPHAHLSVNFGQKPFVFNIDRMMAVSILFGVTYVMRLLTHNRKREGRFETRLLMPTSRIYILFSTKTTFARRLLLSICHTTATWRQPKRSLEKYGLEAIALKGSPESKLEGYLSVEEDHDAMNRQRMSKFSTELKFHQSDFSHRNTNCHPRRRHRQSVEAH